MSDYQEILYEKQRGGALITLNRPEAMNAISRSMIKEIHRALDDVEEDKEVRAVVLTGAGRAFSAGMDQGNRAGRRRDIHWPYGILTGQSAAEVIDSWRVDPRNFRRMWEFGKPIIGAINGWAMGAGSWLSLFTHITIASENAVFAQPEVRHISNTTYLLGALCGWKAANRWGLTGDHFDAQEALRIGMVNEVVPHNELMELTRALAKRIALVPEPAVRLNKAITMMGMQAAGVYSGLLLEGTLGGLVHASHNEQREQLLEAQRQGGLKAYLDMRDGPFQPEPMGPRSAKGRQKKSGK